MVTVLPGAVYPGAQRGDVAAAEYMVNAIVQLVLVVGYAHSNAGFGVSIGHETVENMMGV